MQRKLLSTPLFTVEHRTYLRPGETPIARDVVVHPGAVVILPILDDRHIVMIRNYRYTVQRELWELPAGTMEPDEEPIATARRELEEETGYRAGRMSPMMEFYTSPGILTERIHAFVARDLTVVGQKLQGGERILVETVEIGDLRGRLIRGELVDGKTIAVLGRYFLGLNE
jgi:ADP-ribose pyrophosphatase